MDGLYISKSKDPSTNARSASVANPLIYIFPLLLSTYTDFSPYCSTNFSAIKVIL